MQKIRVVDGRRIRRRLAFTFAIRFVAVGCLLALLTNILLLWTPKVDLAGEIAQIPEKLYTAGFWLFNHTYFILASIMLPLLYRVLRFRTDD